jgi:hypothetical protein
MPGGWERRPAFTSLVPDASPAKSPSKHPPHWIGIQDLIAGNLAGLPPSKVGNVLAGANG